MELLLGCGSSRTKRIVVPGLPQDWVELKTLDIEPCHKLDVIADLNNGIPYPDDTFDEVHAYEILEHLGQQGDVKSFVYTFKEIWRVLKPKGVLCATVPDYRSQWVWGDPGHTRVINGGSLVFLDQTEYQKQVGITAMSDYRSIWTGDFMRIGQQTQGAASGRRRACSSPPRGS